MPHCRCVELARERSYGRKIERRKAGMKRWMKEREREKGDLVWLGERMTA